MSDNIRDERCRSRTTEKLPEWHSMLSTNGPTFTPHHREVWLASINQGLAIRDILAGPDSRETQDLAGLIWRERDG